MRGLWCDVRGRVYPVDHLTAPYLMADARPWIGNVAGAFLTLGLASLWGMLTGATRGGGKTALLASAQATGLPDKDGPMLATGTVRLDEAFGEALTAPLSAMPCVAYWYRMYSVTATASEHRREVPVYWGAACIPFRIESPLRSVRVVAVPNLADRATQLKLEIHVNRAKAFLQSAHLEQIYGIGGALGTAFSIVDDVLAGENQQYRRDWARQGPAIDPSQLLLEETVLAIGANATVVGPLVGHATGDRAAR